MPKLKNQSDFIDDNVTEDDIDFDIVIVGGGLTGLTCAYNILMKSPGLEVLIVEARSEVGGRLLSREYNEAYYASFSQNHITRLVETLNLPPVSSTNRINKRTILYTKNGPMSHLPRFIAAEVHSFFQTLQKSSGNASFHIAKRQNYTENLGRTSVEELLRRLVYLPQARVLCRPFISCVCANLANLNDASALWFLAMLNGSGGFFNRLKLALGDSNRYFIQGGMSEIANKLLEIISKKSVIKYNEPVHSIRYNDDRVYVKTEKSFIKCSVVIVATDPAQHRSIDFQPPLPANFQKSQELYTATQNTFFKVTYGRSLRDNSFTGTLLTTENSNSDLMFLYDATSCTGSVNKYLFAGYTEDSGRKKSVFDILSEYFGADEVAEYVNYKKYDSKEYFGGAAGFPMSVMKPGLMGDTLSYTQTPHERILFASSEYAMQWPGTVDGAIEAGENIAYLLLARIRPQVLTFNDMAELTYKKSDDIPVTPFPLVAIQYLGILLNIGVFISFFRPACADIFRSFKR